VTGRSAQLLFSATRVLCGYHPRRLGEGALRRVPTVLAEMFVHVRRIRNRSQNYFHGLRAVDARPKLADTGRPMMQIHVGFEMIYDCPQPTPMIFNLNVHFTRVSDLVGRDDLVVDPPVPMAAYRDSFGNWCTRIVALKGRTRLSADAIVNDTGVPDVIVPQVQQLPVQDPLHAAATHPMSPSAARSAPTS